MPKYEVKIGDIVLTSGNEIYDVTVRVQQVGHGFETSATIVLFLDRIDPSRVDLHWPIIVEELDAKKRVLYGVIVDTLRISHDKLALYCEGSERYQKEDQVGYRFFSNFTPQEIVFYIARRTPEIEVQEKNIVGLDLTKNRRPFKVIMPIINLDIPHQMNVLGLQLAQANPSSEDEKLIVKYFAEAGDAARSEGQIWNHSKTRYRASDRIPVLRRSSPGSQEACDCFDRFIIVSCENFRLGIQGAG